tara:strand:+ start:314 stop:535 length:222 start_codon:yes stop_codon:yes gene_type:complete
VINILCEGCGNSGIPKRQCVDLCEACWRKHYQCIRGDCKSQWSEGEYLEFSDTKALRREIVMLREKIAQLKEE